MADQPLYTGEEARTRGTFLALLWALSHPGRIQELPPADADGFLLIGQALLDLETSYYTPDPALAERLARTGARALEPDLAAYHFYPTLDAIPALNLLEAASTGTMLYPDQAATLFIGCQLGQGDRFTLSGPGIQAIEHVSIGGVPPALWRLRKQVSRYPLGWDVFLVDGPRVLGLPRTTVIEQE